MANVSLVQYNAVAMSARTSLSARRDAGLIDPNRLARRRTKPGDAGASCDGVRTVAICHWSVAKHERTRRVGSFTFKYFLTKVNQPNRISTTTDDDYRLSTDYGY